MVTCFSLCSYRKWWISWSCQKASTRNLAGKWNKAVKESKQEQRHRGGSVGAAKALICCTVCLHKLTFCSFSTCQQQLKRMLSECVFVCSWVVVFFFFFLLRLHCYFWLSKVAGPQGIKWTHSFSLFYIRYKHRYWNSARWHPHPVCILTTLMTGEWSK